MPKSNAVLNSFGQYVQKLPLPFKVLLMCILFQSCNNQPAENADAYFKLLSELEECKQTVSDLQNTPTQRLVRAQKSIEEKELVKAEVELSELIAKYPGTDEAQKAEILLDGIKQQQKELASEIERKNKLGFKGIKEKSKIRLGELTLSFSEVSKSKNWTFDNYDGKYHYRSAERGKMYLVAKVTITAGINDPKLPPISAYKVVGGQLEFLGTLEYEFVRWKDYGSYLGNYADYGNDFAHSESIPFSCGLQVSNEDLASEIFVVVKGGECFTRSTSRLIMPPVKYEKSRCNEATTLHIDDFDSRYALIKVLK